MIHKRLIIAIVVGLFALAASTSICVFAQADDDWRPLPCELFGRSDIAFVGLVVGIKEDNPQNNEHFFLIEFRVSEAFAGIKQGKNIAVRSSAFFADDIEIATGKSFLVYASDADNSGIFSLNTHSKLLSQASKDLEYLRQQNTNESGGKLLGTVSFIAKSSLLKDYKQAFTSTVVRITRSEGQKKTRETRTDTNGRYEFGNLPASRYQVELWVPEESYSYSDQPVQVNRKGCSKADIEVRTRNEISGKVIDIDGKPVFNVPLELIPDDYHKPSFDVWPGEEVTTSDENGSFSFSNIPTGKYILAVNYTVVPENATPYPTSFYPGTTNRNKARIIEVGTGKEINGIDFILGPERLLEKKISGRVIFQDGRPSSGTTVYLKEDENQICCVMKEVQTDDQGNFTIIGFASRTYRLWAFIHHKPFTDRANFLAASSLFTLGNETSPFQIVLKPTVKNSLDALEEIELSERAKLK